MQYQSISQLKQKDFDLLLNRFGIKLDQKTQTTVFLAIKNNQFAYKEESYRFILENYIKKITNETIGQQIIDILNHYVK